MTSSIPCSWFSEGLPFKSTRLGHAQALERRFDGTGQFFSHSLPTAITSPAVRFLAFDFECIFRSSVGFVDLLLRSVVP